MAKRGRKRLNQKKEMYYPFGYYSQARKIIKMLSVKPFLTTNEICIKLGRNGNDYPQKRANQILDYLIELDYCDRYFTISKMIEDNDSKNFQCKDCCTKRLLIKEHILEQIRNNSAKAQNKGMVGMNHNGLCYSCNKVVNLENHYYNSMSEKTYALSINGVFLALTFTLDSLDNLLKHGFTIKDLNWPKPNQTQQNLFETTESIETLQLIEILIQNQRKEYVKDLIVKLKRASSPGLMKIANMWKKNMKDVIINMSQKNKTLQEYVTKLYLNEIPILDL